MADPKPSFPEQIDFVNIREKILADLEPFDPTLRILLCDTSFIDQDTGDHLYFNKGHNPKLDKNSDTSMAFLIQQEVCNNWNGFAVPRLLQVQLKRYNETLTKLKLIDLNLKANSEPKNLYDSEAYQTLKTLFEEIIDQIQIRIEI